MTHNQWTCSVCGAVYVVQILARDCERKHEIEGNEG